MGKSAGKGRERGSARKRSKGISGHAAELCAFLLAALICVAFFAPQLLFQMQDSLLWEKTQLGEREIVDVKGLDTAYERSLVLRMKNYAEGVAEDNHFYVNETKFSVSEDIYEYLDTEILQQEFLTSLADGGLLSYKFWKTGYTVNQWKQYVIYSDDYAGGVNFILWYLELQDEDGVRLKLLTDAQGSTVYALKTENNRFYGKTAVSELYDYLRKYWKSPDFSYEMWCYLALYYESLAMEDVEKYWEEMKYREEMEREGNVDMIINSSGAAASIVYDAENGKIISSSGAAEIYETENGEIISSSGAADNAVYAENGEALWHLDAEDTMSYRLSYGDFSLDAVIKVEDTDEESAFVIQYPNVTIGIRRIYEMIPEFV